MCNNISWHNQNIHIFHIGSITVGRMLIRMRTRPLMHHNNKCSLYTFVYSIAVTSAIHLTHMNIAAKWEWTANSTQVSNQPLWHVGLILSRGLEYIFHRWSTSTSLLYGLAVQAQLLPASQTLTLQWSNGPMVDFNSFSLVRKRLKWNTRKTTRNAENFESDRNAKWQKDIRFLCW